MKVILENASNGVYIAISNDLRQENSVTIDVNGSIAHIIRSDLEQILKLFQMSEAERSFF